MLKLSGFYCRLSFGALSLDGAWHAYNGFLKSIAAHIEINVHKTPETRSRMHVSGQCYQDPSCDPDLMCRPPWCFVPMHRHAAKGEEVHKEAVNTT